MFKPQGWQRSARLLALMPVLLLTACGGGGGGSGSGSGSGSVPVSGLIYLEGASFTLPAVQEDPSDNVTNVDQLMQALAIPGGHPVKIATGANPYDYQDGTLLISQGTAGKWTFALRDASNNVLAAITDVPKLHSFQGASLGVDVGDHAGGEELDFVVNAKKHIVNGEVYSATQTNNETIDFANGLVVAWGDPVRDALVRLMGSWAGNVSYGSVDNTEPCDGESVTLTIDSDANAGLKVAGTSACTNFNWTLNWSQLANDTFMSESDKGYFIGWDLETPSGYLDVYIDDYLLPTQMNGIDASDQSVGKFDFLETGSMTRN